jgi:hypothetical protein
MSKLEGLLSRLNTPAQEYARHSFCCGNASWVFLQGIPGEMIKILGDWKSQAYLTYLTVPLETKISTN